MKIEKLGAGVFTIDGFLSKTECQQYIKLSEDKGYEIATINAISGPEINKNIRDNGRVITDEPKLANALFQRAKGYLPSVMDGW